MFHRGFLSLDQSVYLLLGNFAPAGRFLYPGIKNIDRGLEWREIVDPIGVVIEKDAGLVDVGQLALQRLALVARETHMILDRGRPGIRRLKHLRGHGFVLVFRLLIDEHHLADIHARQRAHHL